MYGTTPCKVHDIDLIPKVGVRSAAVPGAVVVVVLQAAVGGVVTEAIGRQGATVVGPDDSGHDGMDDALHEASVLTTRGM